MGEGLTGRLIEAGPLPPGFLLAGAVRGLLKRGRAPDLPRGLWTRTVRLDPASFEPYGRLCGFEPEQGVPLTWPSVLAFPLQMRLMMAADFPYPAMGMVHLANQIRQRAQLRPGDELRLTCRSGPLFAHAKGQAFRLETSAERDGAVIWSASSLYLHRGQPGRGSAIPDLPLGKPDHKIDTLEASLKPSRLYARLSGDANPIHTSPLLARILGFPRPIAHGMWTKARAISALTEGRVVDVAEAEVSFRNPLLLPAKAELYAASNGNVWDFECRSSDAARSYLRGRLSLI